MENDFLALVEEANSHISAAGSDFSKFMQCRPQFEKIIDGRLYMGALHRYLLDNLAGKREITPDISSGPFLVLHGSKHASWAILTHAQRSRHLYLAPSHSISARISDSPIEVQTYTAPNGIQLDTLDGEAELVLARHFMPVMNSSFAKDGQREVLDITPRGDKSGLTLRVNTLPFDAFEWSFDRQTLRPNQISSMRQFESNLITIFDLLGAVQSPESLEHLQPFARHPAHFVRWKAIQTVGSIDREIAMELVARAVDDEHPHVRAAALRTMESA